MLGLADFNIFIVYLLCIGSTLICIIYGIINWNKGKDSLKDEILEELKWEETENEIEDLTSSNF